MFMFQSYKGAMVLLSLEDKDLVSRFNCCSPS